MSLEIVECDKLATDILKGIILENISSIRFPANMPTKSFEDFTSNKIPAGNIDRETLPNSTFLCSLNDSRVMAVANIIGATSCTNAIVYPPGSILHWHTNANDPGIRTYYTFSLGRGVFRYKEPGKRKIVNSEDNIGWTCRRFEVNPQKPLWHTVWAESVRFAFGFNSVLPDLGKAEK